MKKGEHYFYVARDGMYFVAAISFEEPRPDKHNADRIVVGSVLCISMQNPTELKTWVDSMSAASDRLVRAYLSDQGLKSGEVETTTILSRIPGVH